MVRFLFPAVFVFVHVAAAQPVWRATDFSLPLHRNFGNPNQLFVGSGFSTVAPRFGTVAGVGGFFSPPLAATGFELGVLFEINGRRVGDTGRPWVDSLLYAGGTWQPDRLVRRGTFHRQWSEGLVSFGLRTDLVPLADQPGFLLKISLTNRTVQALRVGVMPQVSAGRPAHVPLDRWGFTPQAGREEARPLGPNRWGNAEARLLLSQSDSAKTAVAPGRTAVWYVGVTMAPAGTEPAPLTDFAEAERRTAAAWQARLDRWLANAPTLETDIPGLAGYYRRALVSGLVCVWEKPGFVLNPYLATSGIDGGGMNAYLWDVAGYSSTAVALLFGEYAQTLARQLAGVKLDEFYSFTPAGTGIGVSYAYSTHAFTSLVWALARHGHLAPDLYEEAKRLIAALEARPQHNHLIDFGNQHNLLEMRTVGWEHVVPSPNAERAWCLDRLADLAELLKKDGDKTAGWRQKAAQIRRAVQENLWDEKAGWFRCLYPDGHAETVYSVQAFDALRAGACTPAMAARLYGHLKPGKFLGEYGLTSVSAEDSVHYEYGDTDWGGSGAYSGDAPQLALTLYEQRRPDLAFEVLRREFWMGDHLPYVPQEHYADRPAVPAHKRANVVAGLTGAEAVLYGLAGLDPRPDGSLWLDPQLPPGRSLTLRDYRLRGRRVTVRLGPGRCEVNVDGKPAYRGPVRRVRVF
jgi:hypothetical protein